ncbi:MAG: N-6 DNA methylase [Firmicutes bacterium]|nr:N-6 DNA methylase [Bacillota bacterium]
MTATDNQKMHKQYFTPRGIASFMLRFVSILEPGLLTEDSKLMDPSAGEGIFLSEATAQNIVKKENCFAVEKDISLNDHWDMNGYYGVPRKNVIFADTLKLNVGESFKLVVGNPPFGLIKADEQEKMKISRYSIFNDYTSQPGKRKLPSSFPMEVLFLEKFLALCLPGGMIAIVLPHGIFSNSGMEYIRKWLAQRCSIRAIVELHGRFFRSAGASARTTLLFAVKNPKDENPSPEKKTIFAVAENISPEGSEPDDLQHIAELFSNNPNPGEIPEADRIALKIQEKNIDEIGTLRWDPSYFDPFYDKFYEELNSKGKAVKLKDLLIPDGIITGYKGVQKYATSKKRVRYITSKQITDEGIDLSKDNLFVDKDSPGNPERSRIREGDILLVRSGDGCIGRAILATPEIYGDNIRSEIYILRTDKDKASPEKIVEFLKTQTVPYNKRMVHFQIRKLLSGVGTPNLNKEEIGSILIPL